MKKIIQKIKCKKGAILSIEFLIWVIVGLGILFGAMEFARHTARISDCQQIADTVARQISLKGAVDGSIHEYLNSLEGVFNMDVDMDVSGNFIPGTNKLQAETSFEVKVSYKTHLNIGLINMREEKVYVAKAVGTSEEYH